MAINKQIKIEANTKEAADSLKELIKRIDALESANKSNNKEIKKSNSLLGKLGKATQGIGKGFKGASLALKGFIAGLGLKLFEKFTEILMANQRVADSLSVAFGTISSVMGQVINAVIDAGSNFTALGSIVKNSLMIPINLLRTAINATKTAIFGIQLAWEDSFFGNEDPERIAELTQKISDVKQETIDAGKALKNNFVDIGKGFVDTYEQFGDFYDTAKEGISDIDVLQTAANQNRIQQLRNETEIALAENDKLQFEYQLAAERQRQIRDDVTASIEDRTKANEELGRVLAEQFKLQEQNALKGLELAKAELAANPTLVANKVALIDAEKNLADIRENIAGFESEQRVNSEALELEAIELINTKKEAENARAIAKKTAIAEEIEDEVLRLQTLKQISEQEEALEVERLEAQIQRLGEGTQARQDAEQQLLDFQQEKDLEQEEFQKQISAAEKQRTLDQKQLEEDVAQAKKQLAMDGLEAIIQIAGEGSKIGKAAAIAQATIAGTESTINAFKSAAASPITTVFPAFPYIQAGIAAAFAAKNIAQIKSSKGPSASAGGGGGAQAGAPSEPAAPAFNVVGAAPESQLAQTIGEKEEKPLKAFVVSSDVSSAQAMDRNIIESASI